MLSTHVTVSSMHGTLCPVHILCRVYSTCVQYTSQQCLFCTLCLVHRCSALFVRILHIYTVYTVYSVYIYGVYCVYWVYCTYCAYTVYIVYSMQQCLAWIVHYAQLWLSLPYTVYTQTAYTAYTVYTLYSAYNVDLRCILCTYTVYFAYTMHILFNGVWLGLYIMLSSGCPRPSCRNAKANPPTRRPPLCFFDSINCISFLLSLYFCISVFSTASGALVGGGVRDIIYSSSIRR